MKTDIRVVASAVAIVLIAFAVAVGIILAAMTFFAGTPYEVCWVPTYNGIPTLIVDGQPVTICSTVWRAW